MDESFLKKVSFFVFIIGFIGLLCLFIFQKPFFVSLVDNIPSDTSVSLNASILDIYSTSSGSVIVFSYDKQESAFFQGNVSFLEVGSNVLLTGSRNGDFFSIDLIELK